jgi:O-antigen ligase
LGQIFFSIAGLVTFSRTFLLLLFLISIVSLSISYKNSYRIAIGVVLFSLFLSTADKYDFDSRRLKAFSAILDGKLSEEMTEGSRSQTWELYYDKILDKPIFGNGYLSFSGKNYGSDENLYSLQGVHNTFLMAIGEAGILAFLYLVSIYGGFVVKGIRKFNDEPLIFLVSFSLLMYLLTIHNYFDNYLILFVSIWLWMKINRKEIIVEKK